jgi:hypothetical protein
LIEVKSRCPPPFGGKRNRDHATVTPAKPVGMPHPDCALMRMFYTVLMLRKSKPQSTLSLKLGSWFEANATGWGVVAIPVLGLLLMGAALLGLV